MKTVAEALAETQVRIRVRDLMLRLEAMPSDAWVELEGCDCVGFANGVDEPYEDEEHGPVVRITRAGYW